jgi:hypothetical protein
MKIIDKDNNISYTGTLEENRQEAFYEVSQAFEEIAQNNKFMTSFGFEIDNRWIGKDDVSNATCALDAWFEGQTQVYFRDAANQTHILTQEQLVQLKKEGQQNRLLKFSTKWKREYFIELSQTIEQIWQIVEAPEEWIQAQA